jgi:hypothetical protein
VLTAPTEAQNKARKKKKKKKKHRGGELGEAKWREQRRMKNIENKRTIGHHRDEIVSALEGNFLLLFSVRADSINVEHEKRHKCRQRTVD